MECLFNFIKTSNTKKIARSWRFNFTRKNTKRSFEEINRQTSKIRPVASLKQLRGLSKMVKQNYHSPLPPLSLKNRLTLEFKMQRAHQKTPVDLVSKTITLHLDYTLRSCFCLFFIVDYYVKFPNITFEGRRRQTTTNFSFSF